MNLFKLLCLSALFCVGTNLSANGNDGYGYNDNGCGGGATSYGGGGGFRLFRGLGYNCNRAPTYEYGAALWDGYCDRRNDDYDGGGCGLGFGLLGGRGGGMGFGGGGSCFGYPGQNCCGGCGIGGYAGGFRAGLRGAGGFGQGQGCNQGCGVFSGLFRRGGGRGGFGGGGFGGSCFGYPGQDCCGCGGYGVSYNSGGCGIGGRHGISVFGFQRRGYASYGGCGSSGDCGSNGACGQCGSAGNCGCSNAHSNYSTFANPGQSFANPGQTFTNPGQTFSNPGQPTINHQPTPAPAVQQGAAPVQQPQVVQPTLDSGGGQTIDDSGSGIR